jgi:hypothetical protein
MRQWPWDFPHWSPWRWLNAVGALGFRSIDPFEIVHKKYIQQSRFNPVDSPGHVLEHIMNI